MVGHVCVCVFLSRLWFFTAFSLLGTNHLLGIYTLAGPGPLGLQLSSGSQPPRPPACWGFGWSLGMKNPPLRPQPRVIESFRRSLQFCCSALNEVAWRPSGLRYLLKAPVSSETWVAFRCVAAERSRVPA